MPVSAARVLRAIAGEEPTDAELLGRFVARRDEAAFALLVRRHGPMVYGVCRRVLPEPDAEDAFQAVFLVLARKARTAAPREVANWLYGVARRAALLSRRSIARRKERTGEVPDRPAPEPSPLAALRAALDEELGRLPAVYRAVVVLCDLEGRTRREAAGLIGCPEGTVAGRLSRARELLAKRLARHAPAVSVAAVLSGSAAARVPAVLPPSATIPPGVAALTREVLGVMAGGKLMKAAAVVLLLGCAGFGMALRAGQEKAETPKGTPVPAAAPATPAADGGDLADLQGEWVVTAMEGAGEKASADAVKGMRWAVKGNEITGSRPGGSGKMSFKLNSRTTPKEIDVTALDGNLKGTTSPGIYAIDGPRLRVCFGEKVRPKGFATAPGDDRTMLTLEREAITAWGKEVGGLQAGLALTGGKTTYRHGEAAGVVLKVRNVGKEPVEFPHIWAYFVENPPTVTGPDGKTLPPLRLAAEGLQRPRTTTVAPGKEADLFDWSFDLRPAGERDPMNHTIQGTGKFTLQCERVVGPTSGNKTHPNPAMAKLATGKLELEVTAPNAPAARPRVQVHLSKNAPWPSGSRCAFLDDDRILVHAGPGTGDANEVHAGLQVRAARDGKLLKSITVKGQFVGDFRLSADRKWVAAATTHDTTGTFTIPSPSVTVWDAATWTVRGTIDGRRLLDLAADGRTVLVREDDGWGAETGRVEVWDVVEKKRLRAAPFEFKRIDAGALSPDGSLVVVSGLNEIAYWKWRDGGAYDRLKVGRKVDALVFSPDGKFVAEGPDSRITVEVRDAATLRVAQALSDPAQPRVSLLTAGLAFADAGKTLVLGNGVGLIESIPVPHRIHFWDVRSGRLIRQIDMKGGAPYSLDVSPDGKTLAATTADDGVSLRAWGLDRSEAPR